jgi:hypothetical protein
LQERDVRRELPRPAQAEVKGVEATGCEIERLFSSGNTSRKASATGILCYTRPTTKQRPTPGADGKRWIVGNVIDHAHRQTAKAARPEGHAVFFFPLLVQTADTALRDNGVNFLFGLSVHPL